MQPIQLDQFTQTDVRLLELTETELAQAYNIHKSGWLAILSEIQSKTVISVARSPQMAYERLFLKDKDKLIYNIQNGLKFYYITDNKKVMIVYENGRI